MKTNFSLSITMNSVVVWNSGKKIIKNEVVFILKEVCSQNWKYEREKIMKRGIWLEIDWRRQSNDRTERER